MANISDLSGDERAKRIEELKKKAQEAAKRNQAAAEAVEESVPSTAAETVEEAETVVAVGKTEVGDTVVAVKDAESGDTKAVVVEAEAGDVVEALSETTEANDEVVVVSSSNGEVVVNGNGTGAALPASVATASVFRPKESLTEEQFEKRQMNRREFMTYAWGGAMGLLLLQTGVVSFFFMYPRFKAGEFGGKFFMGPASSIPPEGAAPIAESSGKFWWLTVEGEGPKAIYMVCTHLGCLYKWVGENNRFECPCHGSKFTREGLFIEGPAPRSLDEFVVTEENGEFVVDTGARINGAPAADSPARVSA
jgi:cytochrome b6-f complex iron-sulfur subunit